MRVYTSMQMGTYKLYYDSNIESRYNKKDTFFFLICNTDFMFIDTPKNLWKLILNIVNTK